MKKEEKPGSGKEISRRQFVTSTAAGSAYLVLQPVSGFTAMKDQQEAGWPLGSEKFKVHMIGHAHIDPVWLWPWPEGVSIVYSTFRSALDRMKENPEFRFTATSAQFYQWIADNDPAMIVEIKKRVLEGRWDICGGWWIEPDMNIPGGEAMVRQGLYGQLTFEKLFGKRSEVAANPDSFGHTSTLPQIIKGQGMGNYIFMRPGVREKVLPGDHFWWEGIDGTRVLTYRIPISYNDTGSVRKRIEDVLKQLKDQPARSCLVYFGAGDHGGGATKENIRSIDELRAQKGGPEIVYGNTEDYFRELRSSKVELPMVTDDLQHHAVGCYTAESEIKKGNRQSEAALITAEKICAVGSRAWKAKYPLNELRSAWQRVLFLQFHDSLAGTSVPEHSQHAREGYGYALDTVRQATYLALQKLESQIPSEDPDSQYLVAFNPHAWETNSCIEYDFSWNPKISSCAEDENGKALLHQWAAGSTETGNRNRVIVNVTLPPFGYRQIRIKPGEPAVTANPVSADTKTLENEYIKVTFNYSGSLNILDKKENINVFNNESGGCRALVINDPSDTWSHDIKSFSDVIGAFGNATFRVLEKGPVRGIVRSRSTYGNSVLTVDWILAAGSRFLEAKVTLDWQEHLKMLKFSFPVNVDSPVATYETPYGNIIRQTNGDEDPGQRWIDVTGSGKTGIYGLTILNDAKYGYSVHENDLRVSVVRSAVYAHHNPKVLDMNAEHIWQDQGIQTFRMLVVPHSGTWKQNNIVRMAEELVSPALAIYQGIHTGTMPKSLSLMSVDSANIIISAAKTAEKSNDLIIRCVETNGTETAANVSFGFGHGKWSGKFRKYEIKTLRMNTQTGEIKEVNLLEE